MKIEKIVLENFRGWYGKHEIEFSTDTKKPVTLIIAENGTGKSNILEAIMWCLHGILPDNSDKPKEKINNFALTKTKQRATATVRLFVVDDKESVLTKTKNPRYEISRQLKSNDEEPEAVVYELTDNYNKPKIYTKPRLLIDKLIPERLLKFFMFSGEGIEELFKASEELLLKQSVDDMQGLTYAREAEKDIGQFHTQLLSQVTKDTNASNEAVKAKVRYDKLDKDIKTRQQANAVLGEEKLNNSKRMKEIRDEIISSGVADIEALESQRDTLRGNINSLNASKDKAYSILNRLMNDNAATILLKDSFENIRSFLSENTFKSKYPKKYQDEFVDDLLENKVCICGNPFEENSKEWQAIETLRAYAGNDVQMANHEKIQRFSSSFASKNRTFRTGYEYQETEISKIENKLAIEIKTLEGVVSKIKRKGKKTNVDALIKEEENLDYRNSIQIPGEIAQNNEQIKEYKIKLQKEKKKIAAGTEGVDPKLLATTDFIEGCLTKFTQAISSTQKAGRDKLLEKLNELAKKYDSKGQSFKYLNEDSYTPLFLEKNEIKEDPSNTGNTIMKTLYYAIALIDICIERYSDKDTIIQPGTIAPMICDAAFSDLSQANSKAAAELLTSIPEQAVILINAESYQGKFSEVLGKKSVIGKSYLFQRHQQVEVDKSISEINFNNKTYTAFKFNKNLRSNTVVPLKM